MSFVSRGLPTARLAVRGAVRLSLRRSLCAARPHGDFPPPPTLVMPEDMSEKLRRRVAALEAIHAQYEELEESHFERMRQIEQSFQEQTSQLFGRRRTIIDGAVEPTDEEVQASAYRAEFEALAVAPTDEAADNGTIGVPAFWPTALRSCASLKNIEGFEISKADWTVLDYLVDVRSEPRESDSEVPEGWEVETGEPGFSLVFTFAPNPYLTNDTLALHCSGDGELEEVDGPMWADEGANPTIRWATKKVKKKGGQATKKQVAKPVESFFRIFSDPDDSLDEYDEMHDRHATGRSAGGPQLMPLFELQSELILRLKDDVVPRATLHYIHALSGIDPDDDHFDFDDEDFDGSWEAGPSPLPRRR
jgi:nucleosome assembly protein 1-like 1